MRTIIILNKYFSLNKYLNYFSQATASRADVEMAGQILRGRKNNKECLGLDVLTQPQSAYGMGLFVYEDDNKIAERQRFCGARQELCTGRPEEKPKERILELNQRFEEFSHGQTDSGFRHDPNAEVVFRHLGPMHNQARASREDGNQGSQSFGSGLTVRHWAYNRRSLPMEGASTVNVARNIPTANSFRKFKTACIDSDTIPPYPSRASGTTPWPIRVRSFYERRKTDSGGDVFKAMFPPNGKAPSYSHVGNSDEEVKSFKKLRDAPTSPPEPPGFDWKAALFELIDTILTEHKKCEASGEGPSEGDRDDGGAALRTELK